MKMITREMLTEVLSYNPDTGKFFWKQQRGGKKAGSLAGHVHSIGYVVIPVHGRLFLAHRLAWCIYYGDFPPAGKFIDHANLKKSDNRIANLRIATRSENGANRRAQSNSKSQIKGIRCRRGKWQARICVNGKELCLGSFSSIEAAKQAYAKSAELLFGKFASHHEN